MYGERRKYLFRLVPKVKMPPNACRYAYSRGRVISAVAFPVQSLLVLIDVCVATPFAATEPPDRPGLDLVSSRSAVTATTGDPKVELSCRLLGSATEVNAFCADSQSVLQWKVNGTHLDQTQYGSEFLVEGNCTRTSLTFLQVYPVLQGSYTCELSNNATVNARTLVTIRPGMGGCTISCCVNSLHMSGLQPI